MKSLTALRTTTLLILSLLFSDITFSQAQQAVKTNRVLLESANLLIKGNMTDDVKLIQQAKDTLSQWIKDNEHKSAPLMFAESLRLRANTSIALGEINDAIADYKKSNLYDPVAEIQLGLCFIEKEQGMSQPALHRCYNQSVVMFTIAHTPKTDANYLIARILSGDKTAIAEYKQLIQTEQDKGMREIYEMVAQEYLDQSDCQQILALCTKE